MSKHAVHDRTSARIDQRQDNGSELVQRDGTIPTSPKIHARHRERLAIVYVRQSTPQQVVNHRESRARQYALADLAKAWDWPVDRVLVIDEDQGQSGKKAETRIGFQRLLTEVGLDHVGIVLGLEMSRLARSSKDWHHLFELCGIYGTLLADADGVYDPNDPNDRLLLGLKGMMSEVELFTMRARLDRGSLNKAQRGELFLHLPIGYVLSPSGEVQLEPDEQVRSVITLIFDKFKELGTASGVFRYLARNGIRIGLRPTKGPHRGQLEWREPCRTTIVNMLHHPMYAGAYVYGRRATSVQSKLKRQRPSRHPSRCREEWQVLLRDRVPAYITWAQYEANIKRLDENRARWESKGAPRKGQALLGGLVRCPLCGHRLRINYLANGKAAYVCQTRVWDPKTAHAVLIPGSALDRLVTQQVLRVLEPAALELSLQAGCDIQRERQRADELWQKRLERVRYEVDRAARQYNAVEPENRLVVRTLEQRWEEALQNQRNLEEEFDRARQAVTPELTATEQQRVTALATDIPALWHAPTTSNIDRKTIVRHLIESVVPVFHKESDLIDVTIHWQGGFVSQHEVRRGVTKYELMGDFQQLKERLLQLREAAQTTAAIAACLNREGFRTPRQRKPFNAANVVWLLGHLGITATHKDRFTKASQLGGDEWTVDGLAKALKVPRSIIERWRRNGWLHFRKMPGAPNRWLLWEDHDELTRLKKLQPYHALRSQKRGGVLYPDELKVPKHRN